jgi:hypothetical protein
MLEIVIFLEVLMKQLRLHIQEMPISEGFIQINMKKTSCRLLCSDARPDKGACFLLDLKTCMDHDIDVAADWYSHNTGVG